MLIGRNAPFEQSFHWMIFAILGQHTFNTFQISPCRFTSLPNRRSLTQAESYVASRCMRLMCMVLLVLRHSTHDITHLLHELTLVFMAFPFWTVTYVSEQGMIREMYSYVPSHTSMMR
jgi:hypothetical protein